MLMSWQIKMVCVMASMVLLGVVIDLVRRKSLREGYSLLWIGACFVVFLLSVWTSLLNNVAKLLHVAEDNSLLFAGAILFIVIMLLHVSVELTRLRRETKELAQALAISDWRSRQALASIQSEGVPSSARTGNDGCAKDS